MTKLLTAAVLLSLVAARQDAPPKVGEAFPMLELRTVDGKDVKLADYVKTDKAEGKIVMVVFWSYECPSGARAMKPLAELAAWCKEKDVVFVGIDSYDRDTADGAKKFVEDNKIEYPVAYDDKADVAKKVGVRKVLEAFVLDREGKVRFHGGYMLRVKREWKTYAKDAAQALLDGKDVATTGAESVG